MRDLENAGILFNVRGGARVDVNESDDVVNAWAEKAGWPTARAVNADLANERTQRNLLRIAEANLPGTSDQDMERIKILIASRFPNTRKRLQGEVVCPARSAQRRKVEVASKVPSMARIVTAMAFSDKSNRSL